MKVLHLPGSYPPDVAGGAEIYVQGLAAALRAARVDSVICAPGDREASYFHSGFPVHRFTGQRSGHAIEDLYEGDRTAAKAFARILDREEASVVHVHALSFQIGLPLAREVKARGIPLVFTYHNGGATCAAGTLLRWDSVPCDGRLEPSRCAACVLHGRGLPRAVAAGVSRLPVLVGGMAAKMGMHGRVSTALRMRELLGRKHSAIRSFLEMSDGIVAPSGWVRDLLVSNGVPVAKIVVCGQGVDDDTAPGARLRDDRENGPLRVALLSRLDPQKGIDLLVEAFGIERGTRMTLDVFALPAPGAEAYLEALVRSIAGDARIRLMPPIAHDDVVRTLRGYDVLAVPSRIFETGPLVLLEAFAAGIPVLGSDVGGISDRIAHGTNGLLLPRFDTGAWARALRELAADRALVRRLAGGITPPRRMSDVAADMRALYRQIVLDQAACRPHRGCDPPVVVDRPMDLAAEPGLA